MTGVAVDVSRVAGAQKRQQKKAKKTSATRSQSSKTSQVFERAETPEEAYWQCRHLIQGVVNHFLKRYPGLDEEKLMSDAHYAFMIAYQKHDPEKGPFGQRVCGVLRHILLDGMKEEITAHTRNTPQDPSLLNLLSDSRGMDLMSRVSELSEDAKLVVRLALDLPTKRKGPAALRTLLVGELNKKGWNGPRIVKVFREIGEALSS